MKFVRGRWGRAERAIARLLYGRGILIGNREPRDRKREKERMAEEKAEIAR